jgi:hypothetical protein
MRLENAHEVFDLTPSFGSRANGVDEKLGRQLLIDLAIHDSRDLQVPSTQWIREASKRVSDQHPIFKKFTSSLFKSNKATVHSELR